MTIMKQKLPKMFSLSRVAYYLDFFLVPVATLLLCVIALQNLSAYRSLQCLLVGMVIWSLAEYIIHRYIFHDIPVFRPMHDIHHNLPKSYVGVASWGTFTGFGIFWSLIFTVSQSIAVASAVVAGIFLGYMFYITIHDRMHHGNRKNFGKYMSFMYKHHASHHRGGEANFGVTSPIWDYIFRTFKKIK